MSYRIRPASPDDAGLLAEMIGELAEYEKLAHEAHPDANALAEHLDPASGPTCRALIAESRQDASGPGPNEPLGFALFFGTYSTFMTRPGIWLEDLYVRQEFRGSGVGLGLIRAVASIAVQENCGRMEWSVLDWNEPALGFYRRIGARKMDKWRIMRMTGEALNELAAAHPTPTQDPKT